MKAAEKKSMKAQIVVDPYAEMKKPIADWVKATPAFTKKFKPVKFEDQLELDTRKWSEKKLEKALYALIRYELQLFASQGADLKKTADKKGPLGKLNAEREYPKLYDKMLKNIGKKISIALEELESDKGDNKKGLKAGKAALKKMGDLDLKKIFADPRNEISKEISDLATTLKKTTDEAAQKAEILKTEAKVSAKNNEFSKDLKEANEAVKFLLKTATDIEKNKEAAPELQSFGQSVFAHKKDLETFAATMSKFDAELDATVNELKKQKLTADQADKLSKKMDGFKSFDATAKKVEVAVKKLQPEFIKVSKALK